MIPLLEIEAPPTMSSMFDKEHYMMLLKVFLIAGIGFPLCYFAASAVSRLVKSQTSEHVSVLIKKIIIYVGGVLIITTILVELGLNLSAVLGAAGIASVAIGFAAQTSLSNIISGIFLYSEKPFEIGDIIKIGDTIGIVISIDLLSVKIRSFDNQFIRIPNEALIKNQSTTITKFPIRRLTINIGVSYSENVVEVIETLKEVANQNPHCLDEPEPLVLFDKFGESSMDFIFGPWVEKTQFLVLKNSIMADIKTHFDRKGIQIPFPQRDLHFRTQFPGEASKTDDHPKDTAEATHSDRKDT